MTNPENLKQYGAYQKTIGDGILKSMEDAQAKIRESVGDLQAIIGDLCRECAEQLKEIAVLQRDKEGLRVQLESANGRIAAFQADEALYAKLKSQTVKLSDLISDNEAKARKLKEAGEALQKDREKFEREKGRIEEEKRQADEKRKEAERNWYAAVQAQDKAIADKNDAVAAQAAAEKATKQAKAEQERLNDLITRWEHDYKDLQDNLKACKDEREWYKGYAAAVDQKIIDFYLNQNYGPLKGHYSSYLNNPDLWDKHREHFPEFKMPEVGQNSPRCDDSVNAPDAPGYAPDAQNTEAALDAPDAAVSSPAPAPSEEAENVPPTAAEKTVSSTPPVPKAPKRKPTPDSQRDIPPESHEN